MKILLGALTFAIVCSVVPLASNCSAEDPSENEVIINDDDVTSADTTVQGETSSDGGDAVNVVNPGSTTGDAKVEVRVDAEGYADVMRANALVERMILVEDGSCQQGNGQIGSVRICGSSATLSLLGRPQFSCPDQSGGVFGPCQHQGS